MSEQFFIRRIKEGPTEEQIRNAQRERRLGHKAVFYTDDDLALSVEILEVEESHAVDNQIYIRAKDKKKVLGPDELTLRYDTKHLRGVVSPFIPWREDQA